jgi:leucyl-tRNA synthetase
LKSRIPANVGLFLIILVLLMVPGRVFALDSDESRRTLSGIKGVCVMVEELQPNLQKYVKKQSLSSDRLQKLVETQLRDANIPVFSREEWLATPGRSILYLNVNTHEHEKYQFAYNVSLELKQVTSLETNPAIKTLATTWSNQITWAATMASIDSGVYASVKLLVTTFVAAYRSVNK